MKLEVEEWLIYFSVKEDDFYKRIDKLGFHPGLIEIVKMDVEKFRVEWKENPQLEKEWLERYDKDNEVYKKGRFEESLSYV